MYMYMYQFEQADFIVKIAIPMSYRLYNREIELSSQLNNQLGFGIGIFQALSNFALNGIVLGTLYIGGYMMSTHDLKAGDLMSFMVATQTVQRCVTV